MDFLGELENMAANITEADSISNADINMWQNLFDLTYSEAFSALEEYRNDYSRTRIPDELWEAIKAEKLAEGYSREAYEYSLTQCRQGGASVGYDDTGLYIVQLAGPISTPVIIRSAASLSQTPVLVEGLGEDGQAQFCEIDGTSKARLLAWIAKNHPGFKPTIVRISKAKKELCAENQAPMLGKDCTMPQHRPDNAEFEPVPAPNQYPVWYFFYGTLADPIVLTRHLGLDKAPDYIKAHVTDGKVQFWGGKYKALVDAPGESVQGCAFLVKTQIEEDALRFYETDKYEVVRCQILTQSGAMHGLTFRFKGNLDELDFGNCRTPTPLHKGW
ncbi:hypothetical protein B0A52_05852 [Exophiala mesophila]|uniref:Putative gamma-glutamylcyclotransferase n=1 Tax=Exophiala mesophila TaxID=212818 RepID=A0A438N3N8_EXOME|nr:hypothetical protein B0A52_05852 [Exophiala mesophila]